MQQNFNTMVKETSMKLHQNIVVNDMVTVGLSKILCDGTNCLLYDHSPGVEEPCCKKELWFRGKTGCL